MYVDGVNTDSDGASTSANVVRIGGLNIMRTKLLRQQNHHSILYGRHGGNRWRTERGPPQIELALLNTCYSRENDRIDFDLQLGLNYFSLFPNY